MFTYLLINMMIVNFSDYYPEVDPATDILEA